MATSALVCTKDRPQFLRDCVSSLDAVLGADDELIVVEHGDSGAASALAGLRVRAALHRAQLSGKSRQLNEGVREASGEMLVLTDDDCRVDAGWVTAMTAPFTDPAVGVVFGDVVGLSAVRGDSPPPLAAGLVPEVTWEYANGAAMALRRRAVLDVGGFDERLGPGAPLHGEEHDLVLRMFEHGWQARIAAAPPVTHLEWRDEQETMRNLLVYSKGAGAFLGVAVRRARHRWLGLVLKRLRYQARLWRHAGAEGWLFGPRTTAAFLSGFARGLLLGPKRWL
ncbi:glycosyltransferase [soil metagenome]